MAGDVEEEEEAKAEEGVEEAASKVQKFPYLSSEQVLRGRIGVTA